MKSFHLYYLRSQFLSLVEHSGTALAGTMVPLCKKFYKLIAQLIAKNRKVKYSDAISYITLHFQVLGIAMVSKEKLQTPSVSLIAKKLPSE